MESLDTGKEKIKKICEILKNETLEPAKTEAARLLEQAQQEARQIVREGENKAAALLQASQKQLSKERELFDSSIKQGCKQALEALRQEIEQGLFQASVAEWLQRATSEPEITARLLKALIEAIEKEGISTDFSAVVSQTLSSEQVNALLGNILCKKLREGSVTVGNLTGGVQIKLHDKKMTLDMSDQALRELLGRYLRKDFRTLLFQA